MNSLSPFISRSLLDSLFRDVNPGYYVKPLHGDPLPQQIKIDVKETADEYLVQAEIAGAGKENIQVNIDGNVINIVAQINQLDTETKDEKLLRSERYFGEVSRSFQLPVDIDESASKAKYNDGILVLNLAKKLKQAGQRMLID